MTRKARTPRTRTLAARRASTGYPSWTLARLRQSLACARAFLAQYEAEERARLKATAARRRKARR